MCKLSSSWRIALLAVVTLSVVGLCQGSLSIQRSKRASARDASLLVNRNEEVDEQEVHMRRRRDVPAETVPSTDSTKIKTEYNVLEDSHNQLLVHWAGDEVIICLAKDNKANSNSTLFISQDYGGKFTNVTDKILVDNQRPSLDKFFNHPKHNGHFVFTDTQNKLIFTTEDSGNSFNSTKVEFVPDDILFDPVQYKNLIGHEKTTPDKQMWVSQDYGKTWTKVQERVKSVSWDESLLPARLYIQREEPSGSSVIISSDSLFLDSKDMNVALENVEEFQIKDDYIFATKKIQNKDNNDSLEFLISYKHGPFLTALFPTTESTKHFHIADVSVDGQIFLCVVHDESHSNLYVGTVPLDNMTSPQFSLSLERIVFFKPNVTWSQSWLNDVTEEEFVDLHHVEGLRGVYIASQFKNSVYGNKKFSVDEVTSLITYDQGGEWQVLAPPHVDDDGNPIYCQYMVHRAGGNCSLHISQQLSQLYPSYRAVPILSKSSAVGLVLATGTVNTTMKGRLGVYMSTDGAVTWRQLLQGNYLYGFGDHGGIIVATKYYRIGDATNELLYSIDEGDSWQTYKFYNETVRVLGFMTEPGENTTVFFIFASVAKQAKHSWVLIKVDFRDVFEKNCTKDDYKMWSPWDSKPGRHCLLGQKEEYERRDSKAKCYNGKGYERSVVKKICTCERVDFECDFGYMEDPRNANQVCIKDNSETSPGVKPEWCKPGMSFYNKTKGYRKVPGDKCQDSDDVSIYMPETIPCLVKSELEFMLVAKRDSVLRIDLNDFSRIETLPLPRVKSVIAIDFDRKNNCIFWSDVARDHIMKLHLDGESEPELLVSTNLKSVEGLAYDWMAHNLYFSDGAESKIEVIKVNSHHFGRMRKQVLGKPHVEKPRGLAVHPAKGLLFWTDWSADKPSIGRSFLDGSDPKPIVVNAGSQMNVKWPNGITIDYQSDRLFWVDAFLDRMTTADLDGKNVKVFLQDDNRLSHPFAVGVYKDRIYWDDWTTRSIYYARLDADEVKLSTFLVIGNHSRLMDLKVYGSGLQEGSNACSDENNKCSNLCLALPNNVAKCECADGLTKNKDDDICLCPDGKPAKANGTCNSYCTQENSFKCAIGFCVPLGWRCDGDDDCGDGSDEKDCDRSTCTANQFQCNVTGKCIPENFRCDFDIDCGEEDDSDEQGCEGKHPECNNLTHFRCDNGRCILKKWQCDFEDDCGDGGSDEKNCTHQASDCTAQEYKCVGESKCLSLDWVCDGDRDCDSGSDEQNCTQKNCPDWKFHCSSGECIMKSWECDGDKDCPDGSDEHKNCTSIPKVVPTSNPLSPNCSDYSQMFHCAGSKECIPVFWRCDGAKDCVDGSDEAGCSDSSTNSTDYVTISPPVSQCSVDHWRCDSGDCIGINSRCDGFPDCPGKEDETNCHDEENGCPKEFEQCGNSRICVHRLKLCDGNFDCPNHMDELMCSGKQTPPKCNSGQFSCDQGEDCKPLYMMCNGKEDCFDGKDEDPGTCSKHKKVYQIAGISIDRNFEDPGQLEIEWWVDPSLNSRDLLFRPEYCEIESGHCKNSSSWIKERSFYLGDEDHDKLRAFTKYSVTVYTNLNGTEYPPAIYQNFTTFESQPGKPFGINVKQRNSDELTISWKKPPNPNGKILGYKVFFHPPMPPAVVDAQEEQVTISNKQSNPLFRSGVNYTFWVQALNRYGESDNSDAFNYVFNGDVAMVSELKIKELTENSVIVLWKPSNKNVDNYTIILEVVNQMYHFQSLKSTKENSYNFVDLAPKTDYKVTVIPVHQEIHGSSQAVTFSTKGNKLPKVKGLSVDLSKKENQVKVSWTPVSPVQGIEWVYGVYYGRSTSEMTQKKWRALTNNASILILGLDACEDYLFDVGLVKPQGVGPLTETPKQIRTRMDDKAPPKDVQIHESTEQMKVKVTWKAPCPVLDKPLSYNITLRELTKDRVYGVSNIIKSTEPELSYEMSIHYGGRYEVNVTTSVEGARLSSPAYFEGPAIPFPEKVEQCINCHPLTIYWEKPKLPQLVTNKGPIKYTVWVSKNPSFSKDSAKRYETKGESFQLNDLHTGRDMLYVAVSVKDAEGLESPKSSPVIIDQTTSSPQIMLSTNNALAIVLTVIVVIVILVAILAIFVVRHRRLQTSFLNFASSHYSTHSGAATFQQNIEEQDSPVIRGFSDDEPLLVA